MNDGGAAFPHGNFELGDRHLIASPGMSLRDYFAGQALAGFCAESGSDIFVDVMAVAAYRMADAMLEAREAKR